MRRIYKAILVTVVLMALSGARSAASTPPELPRVYMKTGYALPTNGTRYQPQTSADFQNALNSCKLGDIIELQAGTVYKGPFTLPNKGVGTGWIYIISSAIAKLPSPCTRVSPSDAPNMPAIVVAAGAGGAVQTVAGSHHYRFVGIEIKPLDNTYVYSIVQIGNGETTESALPNNIVLDRCYIHGDPVAGSRRSVQFNGAALAVVDSYLADCKEVGADSQGLAAWSALGPIKIVNNYIEGGAENVIFGGSDPSVPNAVPSDIEIRCNYFFKPLKWMQEKWVVKNLLEFKNAQRVLVEGNRFENCWPSGQSGFALLITPRNQSNTAPWCVTQDITIRRNVFINIAQGINMLGMDAPNVSQRTTRVLIQDNVLQAVKMTNSDGRMFELLGDPRNVAIDHNTAFCPVAYMVSDGTPKTDSFSFTNNIVSQGAYGFIGTGTANANTTLAMFYNPNWIITNNAVIGGSSTNYPAGSFFPSTVNAVGFVDTAAGNFRLSGSSPYIHAGTDGKDLGADLDSIERSSTYLCSGVVSTVLQTAAQPSGTALYPSPANAALTIQLDRTAMTNGTDGTIGTLRSITLYDQLGRELLSMSSAKATEMLNTAELPNGAYFLRIQAKGESRSRRFVVRH